MAGGGSGYADGEGMKREDGTPVREITGANRDLIEHVEDGKGGATRRGEKDTGSHEELIGLPSRGGSADEWWRLEGEGAVQVYGRSAPV